MKNLKHSRSHQRPLRWPSSCRLGARERPAELASPASLTKLVSTKSPQINDRSRRKPSLEVSELILEEQPTGLQSALAERCEGAAQLGQNYRTRTRSRSRCDKHTVRRRPRGALPDPRRVLSSCCAHRPRFRRSAAGGHSRCQKSSAAPRASVYHCIPLSEADLSLRLSSQLPSSARRGGGPPGVGIADAAIGGHRLRDCPGDFFRWTFQRL